jgi:hypothetical protein
MQAFDSTDQIIAESAPAFTSKIRSVGAMKDNDVIATSKIPSDMAQL